MGSAAELAVVPAGTLNHFARRLKLPTEPAEALDVAALGRSRRVDVGFVNDRLFLNSSSVGVYVDFVHLRDKLQRWCGYYGASVVSVIRHLLNLPTYSVLVEVDGGEHSYETPLVAIAVGERDIRFPALGDPLENGRPGLHALILRSRSRRRLVGAIMAAARHGHRSGKRPRRLESVVTDALRIDLPTARPHVAVDGEVVRLEAPLDYRIAIGALRVVQSPQ